MSDWPAVIDLLGTELEAAIARGGRRRKWVRVPRFLPPAVLASLLVAAAAVGTTGVIHEGIPVPWSGKATPTLRPLALEPIRASDPAGGPPWGIRLATAGPLVCETVGQVMAGRIGTVRGRVFHALPPEFRDSCGRVPARGALARWSQYPGPNVGTNGARTVVHGVAGRAVVRIEIVEGSLKRTVARSGRGAFVSAFSGLRSPRELQVRAIRSDGTTAVYRGQR